MTCYNHGSQLVHQPNWYTDSAAFLGEWRVSRRTGHSRLLFFPLLLRSIRLRFQRLPKVQTFIKYRSLASFGDSWLSRSFQELGALLTPYRSGLCLD